MADDGRVEAKLEVQRPVQQTSAWLLGAEITGPKKSQTNDSNGNGAKSETPDKVAKPAVPGEAQKQTGDASPKEGAKDAVHDGSDKTKERESTAAKKSFSDTLQRAGYGEKEAKQLSGDAYEQFAKASDNLKGTPTEQMNRLNKSATDILDKKGVRADGKLADGQTDHLTDGDRKNMVRDLAARYASPDDAETQGKHFTCSLESMHKQLMQGGDPAALAESVASMVNTGKAQITNRHGETRTVSVDSRSWKPDEESRQNFTREFGEKGMRGEFGQALDAMIGQVMADRKSERAGLPTSAGGVDKATYKYMTAHSDEIAPNAKTETGEGLFKKGADGRYQIETYDDNGQLKRVDSPGAGMWDVADTNRAMGGAQGALFAHERFAGDGTPPKGYPADLRITTFKNEADLAAKLTEFEKRTGQSAQLLVDAPYLKGGGQAGHGLHVLNISMNKADKTGRTFDIDNNWAKTSDLKGQDYAAVERATNPDKWNQGDLPNQQTIIRPGTGKDSNESSAEFKNRREKELEADRKTREEEEARKKKETEAQQRKREQEEKDLKEREEQRLKKEATEEKERRENEALQLELDKGLMRPIYDFRIAA